MSTKRFDIPSNVKAQSLSVNDIIRRLAVLFTDVFQSPAFEASFDALKLDMSAFLRWLMGSSLDVVADIREITSRKFYRRAPGRNFTSVFGVVEDGPLRDLGTPQLRKIARTALGLHRLAFADLRVCKIFCNFFWTHRCAISYINAGCYIQLRVSGVDLNKQVLVLVLRLPTTFETSLIFHALNFVHKVHVEKKLRVYVNYMSGMCVPFLVHYVYNVLRKFMEAGHRGEWNSCVEPHMFSQKDIDMFLVL